MAKEFTQKDKERLEASKKARQDAIDAMMAPVRLAVLRNLPRQGSKLGFQPIAATVSALVKTLNEGIPREGWISGPALNTQMRILRERGLIVSVPVMPVNRGMGWQITPEGEKWLDKQTKQTDEGGKTV